MAIVPAELVSLSVGSWWPLAASLLVSRIGPWIAHGFAPLREVRNQQKRRASLFRRAIALPAFVYGVACFLLVAYGVFSFGAALADTAKVVTPADKREFLKLVDKLPTDGEFFTAKAVRTAAPHIGVLFALTEQDLGERDIYPFAALSRGLCDDRTHRQYGVEHFADIAHPTLRLFWAAMLFDGQPPVSSEVVTYLREALMSEKQSRDLANILGPHFTSFKKRVTEYQLPAR